MGVTLILETGRNAQLNVETELKPEQELALTLLLPMVVLIVLGRLLKLKHAVGNTDVEVCTEKHFVCHSFRDLRHIPISHFCKLFW